MPFGKYPALLQRHFRLILLSGLVSGLAVLLVTMLMPPTYEAEADLAIVKSGSDVNFDPKFKTVSEFDLAQAVVDQAARRKALASIASSPDLVTAVILQVEGPSNPAARSLADSMRDFTARSDGDLIRLAVKSDSPEKAARLANTWAREFVIRVNRIYGDPSISAAEIQRQADDAKRVYDKKQTALVGYLANNPMGQLNRALAEKQQKLADSLALSIQLDRLLSDAHSLRDRLAAGSSAGSGDHLASLLLEANSFNAASNLASTETAATVAPINLQIQIAPNSGESSAEQLSNLDALIAALETRRKLVQADNVQQLQQQVNEIQAQIEQENSIKKVLTEARDRAWTTFTTLSNKVDELNVAAQAKGTLVKSAVVAIAPTEPVEPRKWLYATLAVVVGLVLGTALAALLEVLKVNSLWRVAAREYVQPEPRSSLDRQPDPD